MRDPRTPIGLKAMLVAALAYVVMPVDLIPDAIPILGQADDLTVLLLVLDLFIQNAPRRGARRAHRARQERDRRPRPRPRSGCGACWATGTTRSGTTCPSCWTDTDGCATPMS